MSQGHCGVNVRSGDGHLVTQCRDVRGECTGVCGVG